MSELSSIEQVISQLDEIIRWSRAQQSSMGYFAMLYRRMTVAVMNGIKTGRFEDAGRMERLDIAFASRYLQAWECYTRQQHCSNAWYTTFEATKKRELVVLQHLVAGVNAHINLDLGIAAAAVAPGDTIFALQHDFNTINDIISSLSTAVQASLCNVWFPLRAIQGITNHREDAILNFSIGSARKAAWANAVALAFIPPEMKDTHINTIDAAVVTVANRIIHPGLVTEMLLVPVRQMENEDVGKNIDLLSA